MHTHPSSFRTVLSQELPSLHAGFLVAGAIVATMMPFGFFAVLLSAVVTLDLAEGGFATGDWRRTAREVFRNVLLDCALFFTAVAVAVYFRLPPPFIDRRGLRLMLWSVAAGGAIALPKVILLYRCTRRFTHPFVLSKGKHEWAFAEILWVFVIVLAALSLFLAPWVLPGGSEPILRFLGEQLAFWQL